MFGSIIYVSVFLMVTLWVSFYTLNSVSVFLTGQSLVYWISYLKGLITAFRENSGNKKRQGNN